MRSNSAVHDLQFRLTAAALQFLQIAAKLMVTGYGMMRVWNDDNTCTRRVGGKEDAGPIMARTSPNRFAIIMLSDFIKQSANSPTDAAPWIDQVLVSTSAGRGAHSLTGVRA